MRRRARSTTLRWLVENKIHLGLFAAVAVWAWARAVKVDVVPWDYLIVPLLAVATYQWNRLTDPVEDAVNCPEELHRAQRHAGAIRGTAVLAVTVALVVASSTGHRAAVWLAVGCVVLGYAYGTALPFGRRQRLKARFILKNVSGALGWSALVVLYPGVHAGLPATLPFLLAATLMFLGVWGVELVWDLRDIEGDRRAHVESMPIRLGPRRARRIGYALNLLGFAIVTATVVAGRLPVLWLIIGANSIAVCAWLRWFGLEARRGWSHALVVLESGMLLAMGFLPW